MYFNYIAINNAFEITYRFFKERFMDFGMAIVERGLQEQWLKVKFNRPLYQINAEPLQPENFNSNMEKRN